MEAKDIHKEMLPMYDEHACHVRQSINGCRSSLSGERFPDDDAVERAVRAWFRQQLKEFYAAGFQGQVFKFVWRLLKNKCCLYVIISILFFSITICNLLIESPSYYAL